MLTEFNKIVLLVATILLISGLIILGIFISNSLKNENFPPVETECPDYWDVMSDSNGTCKDIQKINSGYAGSDCRPDGGILPSTTFEITSSNFTTYGYTADDALICRKQKWANKCNVHWDGITNNPKACSRDALIKEKNI